jgi:hypothetical protein
MTRSIIPALGAAAQKQIREQLTPKEIAADKPNKYRNKKCEAWGIKFDSIRERDRFGELLLLQKAGEISKLEAHPRWPLDVNGAHLGHYTADNTYVPKVGAQIIEDVKSKPTMTAASMLRIKLFEAIYNCRVIIVE